MGKKVEDRALRILSIYSKLLQGQVIDKVEESFVYGVTERTIQRDISDIQCFLHDQNNDSGEEKEVIFDRKLDGYRLETRRKHQLEAKELLAVCKILLESRSLMKEEMFPIINKLLNTCDEEDSKFLREFIRNEMHHYIELRHGKKLIDILWELEDAVRNQKFIEIRYKKLKNEKEVVRKVRPVGVMFSEYYYYLTAFIDDEEVRKDFEVEDDAFPTIYRIDRIKKLKVLEERFHISYSSRFEEGEFRKRVQFMYGGKLQKVKFTYSGNDIDAVLDRLPTAVVLSEKDGVFIVSAEVFGKGIDMWMRSQGDFIKRDERFGSN